MKVVAWNIRFGANGRCAEVAADLVRRDPDVIVLSEYQQGTSSPLMLALGEAGWSHQVLSLPPLKYGGVAVASRTPLEHRTSSDAMKFFDYRYLAVGVPAYDLELRGVYAPLHKDPYPAFWNGMLADLRTDADRATLVIGDFNAGESCIDSPSTDVFCSSYFTQLPGCGYQDLWRAANGADAREFTWLGPVNPYRLDHAFGTTRVAERLSRCVYDHEVRTSGLSDHSLLSVELA